MSLQVLFLLTSITNANEYSILDHKVQGCPTNSLCNKKLGTLNLKWESLLKSSKPKLSNALNNFKNTHGLPLQVWGLKTDENFIQWDSHCSNHRPPNEKIYQNLVFKKGLNTLNNNSSVYVPKIFVERNKKIVSYPSLAGETPLFISRNKLVYNQEQSGNYYSLTVASNGKVQAQAPIFTNNPPQEVSCSPNLVASFKAEKAPNNLYKGHYCKALWNNGLKRYETVILGWSCN